MIKFWRKLTFGTGERVVNVLAVIITAPILPIAWWLTRGEEAPAMTKDEREKQAKTRYIQSKCEHIWVVGRISACLFCQCPMPDPRLSWESAPPRPCEQS